MPRLVRFVARLAAVLAIAGATWAGALALGQAGRLPDAAELAARYRAAGLPERLDAASPHLLAALAAAPGDERDAFIRQECPRREIGLGRDVEDLLCAAFSSLVADDATVRLWWLNSTWFGRGAYGVEAAAQAWFGRGQAGLSRAEAALLVGIARTPTLAERAPERLVELLALRLHLSPAEREAALAAILPAPR